MSFDVVDVSGRSRPVPSAREEAALVVVDVQRDFCDPEHLPWLDEEARSRVGDAVTRVARLVERARAADVRVVWVRLEQDPESPWWSSLWLRGLLDASTAVRLPLEPCVAGTPGADWFRVSPATGEDVVVKRRYSAFHGTDLDALLRSRGITWLAVCGMTTDCCVDATVRDGFQSGYRTFLVADATASYLRKSQEHAFSVLANHSASVVTADTVARVWERARLSDGGAG